MTPLLPLGERATSDVPFIVPPPQPSNGAVTEREQPQPATSHDADDALTGEIEPNLWNGFGRLPMTRRTELAAQAVAATTVLLAFAVGCLVTRYQAEHQATNAPVAAQAGTMVAGLLWSLLLVPATLAAVWFAARFALHVIAERHEAEVAHEQITEEEDAAPDTDYQASTEPHWQRPPNAA